MFALPSLVLSLFFGVMLMAPQSVHADTMVVRTQANPLSTYTLRYRYTPPPVTPPTTTPPAQQPPVTTTPPPPVNNPPVQTASYETQLEQAIFDKINIQREQNGQAKLILDAKLATLARAHSADMIAKNYFSHNDLSGCDPGCRLKNSLYSYSAWGENIYSMTGYSLTPSAAADMVVQGWMNSAGHRANILSSTFTNQGIGVAMSGSKIDVTQDFSKPR